MRPPLSPEDLRRLDTLFERASELPAAEHADFLEHECGPASALREELEHLLTGLAGDDLLGAALSGGRDLSGEQIGPYRLLERLGIGGMGEVYLAEQLEPITRRVALKLIRPGMGSPEVVARFHAERQALARMNHPNVAQVLGAGTTESGQPYFAMEYVDGEPINTFCDRHRLTTRERLQILISVCEGVQHAHQKGLIHRDIKPSNLLVAMVDGRPLAKVIDFGVARTTSGRPPGLTMGTHVGQLLGTLEYMSPEQADQTGVDLDVRSDIYSLGVVLYQLVSGLLPHESRSTAATPLFELLRTIREDDPVTPSTHLRRKTASAGEIATLHGTRPGQLARQLAGDLDWICLKALARDPERRYASASELAADLRRHLAHEPVMAGRPGLFYRTSKFVRRHRLAVAAGVLVVGAGLAGAVATILARADARASQQLAAALKPLADTQLVRELERRADDLWPLVPGIIPDLVAWQADASALLEQLPAVQAEVAELRDLALPWSAEDRSRDRATSPHSAELDRATTEVTRLQDLIAALEQDGEAQGPEGTPLNEAQRATWREDCERRLLELEARVAQLEAQAGSRRTWLFASEDDRLQHELQTRFLEAAASLTDGSTGLMSPDGASVDRGLSMPRRLESLRQLEASFAPGGPAAAAWQSALPELHAAYPGLELEPQFGLLPLGPDEDSGFWEFADLRTGVPPERDEQGELILTEDMALVFVLLPGGKYLMGAQWEDPGLPNYDPSGLEADGSWGQDDGGRRFMEGPVHEVLVPAFLLSKFEMTQAQWRTLTGSNPSLHQPFYVMQESLNPVNSVTWSQCDTVTGWLGLELPSEEQWEYAARAGTDFVWWTGDEEGELLTAANLAGSADGSFGVTGVGRFPANPFGLHGVLGNVSEFCSNQPYQYGPNRGQDPPPQVNYVARGGSARLASFFARSACRPILMEPDRPSPACGLRPARSLTLQR